MSDDISAMRVDYKPVEPVKPDNLPTFDPMKLFEIWFNEARNYSGIQEANSMVVATANKDGKPSARFCLLKGFDESGFKFYTNYQSRKGRELEENPQAALVFYWEPLHKSIRIEGSVEKLSQAESEEYFYSRPHGSQIGACISKQSHPIESKKELEQRFKEISEQKSKIEKPDSWGGYLVKPNLMEFWQGEPNRLHDRIEFLRDGSHAQAEKVCKGENGWSYRLLSP